MPLPVAHSLAGATIFAGLDADGTRVAWRRFLLAVFIANFADIDLVPGILVGEPNRYHHVGFTHSLLFAVVAGLLVGAVAAAAGKAWPLWHGPRRRWLATALMVGLLMASHVVLDSLTLDTRVPVGVPMFWPLSGGAVQIYPWFYDVAKLGGEGSPLDFVASLLAVHNLKGTAFELLMLGPLLLLVAWWRSRSRDDGKEPRDDERRV